MTVFVGTCGWQYDEWRPHLYEGIPKARWLEHYATRFGAVEVNNTFYNLPKEETFASWRDRTPPGFVFALKASRRITHILRLRECAQSVEYLVKRAAALGDKLGPILYQLPPSEKRNDGVLDEFLAVLPPSPGATIEFRSSTWFDDAVFEKLRARDIALCISHGHTYATPVVTTAGWAYFRLHGGPDYAEYTLEEKAAWIDRIAGVAATCDPVFVFFDNDVEGAAVRDSTAIAAGLAERGVRVEQPAGSANGDTAGSLF
jgi:uncharacterized protein YecE (DUF72 family)